MVEYENREIAGGQEELKKAERREYRFIYAEETNG